MQAARFLINVEVVEKGCAIANDSEYTAPNPSDAGGIGPKYDSTK